MRVSGRWDPSLWTPAADECLCAYDFGNIFDIRLKGRLMKTHRFVVALTLLNLALLIFTLAQLHPAAASPRTRDRRRAGPGPSQHQRVSRQRAEKRRDLRRERALT